MLFCHTVSIFSDICPFLVTNACRVLFETHQFCSHLTSCDQDFAGAHSLLTERRMLGGGSCGFRGEELEIKCLEGADRSGGSWGNSGSEFQPFQPQAVNVWDTGGLERYNEAARLHMTILPRGVAVGDEDGSCGLVGVSFVWTRTRLVCCFVVRIGTWWPFTNQQTSGVIFRRGPERAKMALKAFKLAMKSREIDGPTSSTKDF